MVFINEAFVYVKNCNVNPDITIITYSNNKKLEVKTNEFVDDIRHMSYELNHVFSICAKGDFIDPRIIQTLLCDACIETCDYRICRIVLDSKVLDLIDRIEEAFVQRCGGLM